MLIQLLLSSQCLVAFADCIEGTEVYLSQRTRPKQGGILGPSKAPAKRPILPISVFLNDANGKLTICNESYNTYSYYIYNEDGVVVTQGVSDLSSILFVDLYTFDSGEYCIELYSGDDIYIGVFDIERIS